MGDSNTVVSAYTTVVSAILCIGTYNSIALTHQYVFNELTLVNESPDIACTINNKHNHTLKNTSLTV